MSLAVIIWRQAGSMLSKMGSLRISRKDRCELPRRAAARVTTRATHRPRAADQTHIPPGPEPPRVRTSETQSIGGPGGKGSGRGGGGDLWSLVAEASPALRIQWWSRHCRPRPRRQPGQEERAAGSARFAERRLRRAYAGGMSRSAPPERGPAQGRGGKNRKAWSRRGHKRQLRDSPLPT